MASGTLGVIGHRLALGPSGRADTPAQVVKGFLWKLDAERANGCIYCHGIPFSDGPRRNFCNPALDERLTPVTIGAGKRRAEVRCRNN
jgi:hypothetical protein